MSIYHKQVSIKDIAGGFKIGVTNTASFFYHFSPSTVVSGLSGLFSNLKRKPKPEEDLKVKLASIFSKIPNDVLGSMSVEEFQSIIIDTITVSSDTNLNQNISTVDAITVDSTTGEILESDQSSNVEDTIEHSEAHK